MGECRDCKWWEPLPLRGLHYTLSTDWNLCRRLTRGDALTVRPFPASGVEVLTAATFGCNYFQPPEPTAPDWQALAERRGAALEQAWQTIHQAAYVLPRAERWLPEARDSLVVVWEDVAREVAAARDAGPEAR